MNIFKSTFLVVIAVLSLVQTSSAKAKDMDILRHLNVEKSVVVSYDWNGHKDVWVGHYVGKGRRLVVVNFQGAKISTSYSYDMGVVGARVVDTRYYGDTGYVYTKIALDGDTDKRAGLGFHATFNYSITVYEGTLANNAKSTF